MKKPIVLRSGGVQLHLSLGTSRKTVTYDFLAQAVRALERGSHLGYLEATICVWGRVSHIAQRTPIGWFILQWVGSAEGPPMTTTVTSELVAVFEHREQLHEG